MYLFIGKEVVFLWQDIRCFTSYRESAQIVVVTDLYLHLYGRFLILLINEFFSKTKTRINLQNFYIRFKKKYTCRRKFLVLFGLKKKEYQFWIVAYLNPGKFGR
jgi:hypothetical protein